MTLLSMTPSKAILAAFVLFSAPQAWACDEMCKDTEYYSDEQEMCVSKSVES
ncbi:MAG: hypothetical protein AAF334_04100 [Pseudomonadota bacterium]